MMRCIGGGGTKSGYTGWDGIGAIGYADTDKVVMSDGTLPAPNNIEGEYHDTNSYGDVKLMTYTNQYGKSTEIIDGDYEFWSAQWLFTDGTDAGGFIAALEAFASDPANMPADNADYWASQGDMKVTKDSDYQTQYYKAEE
jgi:hypothetical protein